MKFQASKLAAAPAPDDGAASLAPWTPPREDFGRFLCDVFDDWFQRDVGKIFVQLFEERVAGDHQRAFGRLKREPLPQACLACPHLGACFGGCPKHRFVHAASGTPDNYLCPSYRKFFAHTAKAAAEGEFLTGLLYLDPKAEDLHAHFKTSATPLNQLGVKELCPGSEMLDKINTSLR